MMYKCVNQKGIVRLVELGSSMRESAASLRVKRRLVRDVDIEKIRQPAALGRNPFYVADKEISDSYFSP